MNGDKVRIVMSSRRLSNQRKKIFSMYAALFRNRNPVSNLEGSHSEFIIRLKYGEIPRLNAFAAIRKSFFCVALRSKYPFVNSKSGLRSYVGHGEGFHSQFYNRNSVSNRDRPGSAHKPTRATSTLLYLLFNFFKK